MGKRSLGERIHIVPLLEAQQISATTSTTGINMGLFNKVDFIIQLGALATANFALTMEECTAAAGTSNDAIAFEYRVSAAAGTDTLPPDKPTTYHNPYSLDCVMDVMPDYPEPYDTWDNKGVA